MPALGPANPTLESGRIVIIDARPQAVSLDTSACAVLVIDMQNDFGSVDGMFARAGIDISMIQRAVQPTRRVLATARRHAIPVIYLKMAFRRDLSDAGPIHSPNLIRHQLLGVGTEVPAPDGSSSRILVRDTWSTDIVAELAPAANDILLYKHRFSGFFETSLDDVLKSLGVKHLVVTGCTTSICVESTIRDAMFRDYCCVLLEDCTGEPLGHGMSRSNHEASLLSIEMLLGWVSSSEQFIRAIEDKAQVPPCHDPSGRRLVPIHYVPLRERRHVAGR